jgi:hypothetical protein
LATGGVGQAGIPAAFESMNLNSPFTQWLLKWGLSKGGIAVQYLVGLAIGAIAKQHIIPDADLGVIQNGLQSGGTALLAAAYGFLVWWLQHRAKDGVRVLQTQLNASVAPSKKVEVDGLAGNATVQAAAQVTGVPVAVAAYTI